MGHAWHGHVQGAVGLDFDKKTRTFEEKEKVETPKPPPHPSSHVRLKEEHSGSGRDETYWLMQPVYDKEYLESVRPKHKPPETVSCGFLGVVVWYLRARICALWVECLGTSCSRHWIHPQHDADVPAFKNCFPMLILLVDESGRIHSTNELVKIWIIKSNLTTVVCMEVCFWVLWIKLGRVHSDPDSKTPRLYQMKTTLLL